MRAPYQVLVIPFIREKGEYYYAIFKRRDLNIWQFIAGGGEGEVDVIWAPCLTENFYEEPLKFFLSGDCLVFIVKGSDAVARLNDLVGHYDPARAEKYTIRYRFGRSAMENVIHSTATEEMFWREASLFFTQSELKNLTRII